MVFHGVFYGIYAVGAIVVNWDVLFVIGNLNFSTRDDIFKSRAVRQHFFDHALHFFEWAGL